MDKVKLKEIAKEIAKREWFLVIERPRSPVLGWDGNISSINKSLPEILHNPIRVGGFVFFKNKLMVDMKDHFKINQIILDKYKNDKKDIQKLAESMEGDCNKYRKTIKELDINDLESIKIFFDIHSKTIHHFRWIFNATEVFEKLTNKTEETPIKRNFITKYHIELNEIIKEIRKNESLKEQIKKGNFEKVKYYYKINKKINDFLQRFDWIRILHHQGELLDFHTLMNEIKSNLDNELPKIDKEEKSNIPEDQKLLRYFIFLRTHLSESNAYADAKIKPALERLAKKFNLKYDDIAFLTEKEIAKMIDENKLTISIEKIRDRQKNGYACIDLEGEYYFIEGKSLKTLYNFFNKFKKQENYENINKITGTPANDGYVKGKAKVITNADEFDKFEAGDILIANSTTPNYIPIMAKASAFLTDEGGITCHAAIVSRELNKPCIIGLKYATKVFKDGDLLEIDAEKGIVRKVNN